MPQPLHAFALSAPQIVQVLRVSSFLPLARAMRFSYSNFFSCHDMISARVLDGGASPIFEAR